MIIKVNNKEMELAEHASLQQLAELLQVPDKGVAVAVNNQMTRLSLSRQPAADDMSISFEE